MTVFGDGVSKETKLNEDIWVRPCSHGISVVIRDISVLSLSLSLSLSVFIFLLSLCTKEWPLMRRELSISQETSPHLKPNLPTSWSWTSQSSEWWENKSVLFKPPSLLVSPNWLIHGPQFQSVTALGMQRRSLPKENWKKLLSNVGL